MQKNDVDHVSIELEVQDNCILFCKVSIITSKEYCLGNNK